MLQPEVITVLGSLNTRSEITEAWDYLRRKARQLSIQQVNTFQPGQRVQFPDRRGVLLQGIVRSVNRTTVSVLVQDPSRGVVAWRVAASLLTDATT